MLLLLSKGGLTMDDWQKTLHKFVDYVCKEFYKTGYEHGYEQCKKDMAKKTEEEK